MTSKQAAVANALFYLERMRSATDRPTRLVCQRRLSVAMRELRAVIHWERAERAAAQRAAHAASSAA